MANTYQKMIELYLRHLIVNITKTFPVTQILPYQIVRIYGLKMCIYMPRILTFYESWTFQKLKLTKLANSEPAEPLKLQK